MKWVPRGIIVSRAGHASSGTRFPWARTGARHTKDKRPLIRYACVGSCGMRFKSRAVERACRTCGGELEARGEA